MFPPQSRVDFLKLMMEAHKLETEREEDQLEETEENPDVTIATKQCASPQKSKKLLFVEV